MAFLIPGSVLLIEPVEDRLFFRIGNAFSMVCYGEAEILFFKEDFQVYGFSLAGVGHGVVHKDREDLDDPVFIAADLGQINVWQLQVQGNLILSAQGLINLIDVQ